MIRLPLASDSDRQDVPAPSPMRGGERPMRLLVSACLLGQRVRYDGGHKYDAFVVDSLGRFVEWEPICPESDCGMPTPRPSMHLVASPQGPRLVSRKGVDLTEQMRRFIDERLRSLEGLDLCGYICKKDSPSSGMTRVKVYDAHGAAERIGVGLFTRAFMERFPLVPVEEEGRLHDPVLREAFIERIFCRRRWLDLVRKGRSRRRLIEFHTDHKLLLLAHGAAPLAALGRLVASAKSRTTDELFAAYERAFEAAVARPATVKQTSNVLEHMLGYFKRELTHDEKAELLETIAAYRRARVPVLVPLTLLKHYVRKYGNEYLARQVYLAPYPEELMLRNHV